MKIKRFGGRAGSAAAANGLKPNDSSTGRAISAELEQRKRRREFGLFMCLLPILSETPCSG